MHNAPADTENWGYDVWNFQVHYKVALVNAQGKNCSRCLFNAQCYDCVQVDPENAETTVLLQPSDTLALTYFR